ncbi:MAG: hypothetical protein ABI045_05935 [Flavobacteriales bacterium]
MSILQAEELVRHYKKTKYVEKTPPTKKPFKKAATVFLEHFKSLIDIQTRSVGQRKNCHCI